MASPTEFLRSLPHDSLAAYRETTRQTLELELELRPPLATLCQQFLASCIFVLRKHHLPQSISSKVASLYSLNTLELDKLHHAILSDKDDNSVWEIIFSLVETKSKPQIPVPSTIQDTPHRRNTDTLPPSALESGKSQTTHADIDPYLHEELKGHTFYDSDGFFDAFFPAKACVSQLFQKAVTSGLYTPDKGWAQWPDTPHQNGVLRFV